MKKLISLLCLLFMGIVSYAQDTAYISRDRVTALFFKEPVKIVGKVSSNYEANLKESGIITLKATVSDFRRDKIWIQDQINGKLYIIPLAYSYGRAGRRMEVPRNNNSVINAEPPENSYRYISNDLASGKRKNVIDHSKVGGVKAWVNKLSLAGNRIFFRLDVRNHSNLPYDIDFVRFYIRDLKRVTRMATHEQEILPVYLTLKKHTSIIKGVQIARVFAFRRFSLSEDQALNVEIYERNGNRHLYLKIKEGDLDNLKMIQPVKQRPANMLAANKFN